MIKGVIIGKCKSVANVEDFLKKIPRTKYPELKILEHFILNDVRVNFRGIARNVLRGRVLNVESSRIFCLLCSL